MTEILGPDGQPARPQPPRTRLILKRTHQRQRRKMIEALQREGARFLEIKVDGVQREGRPYHQVFEIIRIDEAGVWGVERERA